MFVCSQYLLLKFEDVFIIFKNQVEKFFKQLLGSCNNTKFSTEAHTSNSTVWPVPYACAQPYHLDSGTHSHLFHLM